VDVDLIIQSIHEGNTNDIAFTVSGDILNRAEAVSEAIAPSLRNRQTPHPEEAEVIVERGIAKIAIAGAGMIGRPGVAALMFKTLADAGVNIEMISTSEIQVSCVIDEKDGNIAIASLCKTFDIDSSPSRIPSPHSKKPTPPVRGVALDLKQARLAIRQVPNRAGMAAKIFGLLAEQNISVDTIIQSQRCRVIDGIPTRDIACTISQIDAEIARITLEKAAVVLGYGEVLVDPDIAKVSIVGAGMVGHPGVAAKMFAALSEEQINIQMITTSEIKISCVVAEDRGINALQIIHKAFGLAGINSIKVPA
jgi:aspartate kinase